MFAKANKCIPLCTRCLYMFNSRVLLARTLQRPAKARRHLERADHRAQLRHWRRLIGPFPAMASFARGGAMTTVDSAFNPSLRSPGLGRWRHMHGRDFKATVQAFLFGADGQLSGRQVLRQRIRMAGPLEFSAQVSTQVYARTGNLLATGCASSERRRLG